MLWTFPGNPPPPHPLIAISLPFPHLLLPSFLACRSLPVESQLCALTVGSWYAAAPPRPPPFLLLISFPYGPHGDSCPHWRRSTTTTVSGDWCESRDGRPLHLSSHPGYFLQTSARGGGWESADEQVRVWVQRPERFIPPPPPCNMREGGAAIELLKGCSLILSGRSVHPHPSDAIAG